jgi:hypothetical protein
MSPDGSTRRRVLVAAGTAGLAALAGCNTGSDGDERRFRAADFHHVDENPSVATWPSYPVDVPASHRRGSRAAATDAIATLPTPLSVEAVPNGHVREHLTEAVGDARMHLTDAFDASNHRLALRALREARWRAHYAAGGWAAIDDGRTVDDVLDDADAVKTDAFDAIDDHDHVGTDPVEAVVLHASVEELLAHASRFDRDVTHDTVRVLQVAGHAESVERARASLEDAVTLRDRYRNGQPDDAASLADRFEAASNELAGTARDRREGLPTDYRDVTARGDDGLAESVLQRAHRRAFYRGATEPAGPASEAVASVELLGALEAFRTLRDRVDDGERFELTEPDDLQERYRAAHDALATVPDETAAPELARAALVDVAADVQSTDAEFARLDGELAPHEIDHVHVLYVVAAAVTEGVATATDEAVDALVR